MFVLLAAAALAGQSQPASALSGNFDLTCESASLVMHIGVAGSVGGVGGAWGDHRAIPLSCDGIDEQALADELYDDCVAEARPCGPWPP